MYQELLGYVGKIENKYLRQAVEYYFVKDESFIKKFFWKFWYLPDSVAYHLYTNNNMSEKLPVICIIIFRK